MLDGREKLADDIRGLIHVQGAEQVTITLSKVDAAALALDLDWCVKSTDRKFSAVRVVGNCNEQ